MLGLHWDNGEENGSWYSRIGYILGLYWDNGEENESYYVIIGFAKQPACGSATR